MTDLSFIDYWNAVDAALEKFFGLHSGAAGVAPYGIAIAQEEGDDPERFALWFGEKGAAVEVRRRRISASAQAQRYSLSRHQRAHAVGRFDGMRL